MDSLQTEIKQSKLFRHCDAWGIANPSSWVCRARVTFEPSHCLAYRQLIDLACKRSGRTSGMRKGIIPFWLAARHFPRKIFKSVKARKMKKVACCFASVSKGNILSSHWESNLRPLDFARDVLRLIHNELFSEQGHHQVDMWIADKRTETLGPYEE